MIYNERVEPKQDNERIKTLIHYMEPRQNDCKIHAGKVEMRETIAKRNCRISDRKLIMKAKLSNNEIMA